MAHYPPYASKWNTSTTLSNHPVEHKVFPHITGSMQGVILKSYETVQNLFDKTTTKKGLKVISNIIDKTYKTGRKYANDFRGNMKIIFDDYLGKWNYTVIPANS